MVRPWPFLHRRCSNLFRSSFQTKTGSRPRVVSRSCQCSQRHPQPNAALPSRARPSAVEVDRPTFSFTPSTKSTCTNLINGGHILEPKCKYISPKPSDSRWIVDDPVDLLALSKPEELKCRNQNYVTSYIWANDETVREALHIREGTIRDWTRCNQSLAYKFNLRSVVEYHQLLSERGFQALVYNGDHDMGIPYIGTLKWIRQLNVTLDELWRPWTVDGQVAGYTEKYKHNQAYIIFATVKGAGHTAPEYKPKECLAMIKRWLSLYPL